MTWMSERTRDLALSATTDLEAGTTVRDNAELARPVTDHAALLQTLGMVSLRHAQPLQGLALIYLAHHLVPADRGIIERLAHAFLMNGEPDIALATLSKLDQQRDDAKGEPSWSAAYIEAKALLAIGRVGEARKLFALDVAPSIGARPAGAAT